MDVTKNGINDMQLCQRHGEKLIPVDIARDYNLQYFLAKELSLLS
jgi:hypothetical protein